MNVNKTVKFTNFFFSNFNFFSVKDLACLTVFSQTPRAPRKSVNMALLSSGEQ